MIEILNIIFLIFSIQWICSISYFSNNLFNYRLSNLEKVSFNLSLLLNIFLIFSFYKLNQQYIFLLFLILPFIDYLFNKNKIFIAMAAWRVSGRFAGTATGDQCPSRAAVWAKHHRVFHDRKRPSHGSRTDDGDRPLDLFAVGRAFCCLSCAQGHQADHLGTGIHRALAQSHPHGCRSWRAPGANQRALERRQPKCLSPGLFTAR